MFIRVCKWNGQVQWNLNTICVILSNKWCCVELLPPKTTCVLFYYSSARLFPFPVVVCCKCPFLRHLCCNLSTFFIHRAVVLLHLHGIPQWSAPSESTCVYQAWHFRCRGRKLLTVSQTTFSNAYFLVAFLSLAVNMSARSLLTFKLQGGEVGRLVPWVGGPLDASFGFYLREAFQSQTARPTQRRYTTRVVRH